MRTEGRGGASTPRQPHPYPHTHTPDKEPWPSTHRPGALGEPERLSQKQQEQKAAGASAQPRDGPGARTPVRRPGKGRDPRRSDASVREERGCWEQHTEWSQDPECVPTHTQLGSVSLVLT